jgi:hypothetical protein
LTSKYQFAKVILTATGKGDKKMDVNSYLRKKYNLFYDTDLSVSEDSCLDICSVAWYKLNEKKGRNKSQAVYSGYEELFPLFYKIEGDLPNKYGQYIHICNNGIPDIAGFMSIQGHVCFSDLGARQLIRNYNNPVIGIIVEGTPEESFSYDCWSEINSDGTRKATADNAEHCVNEERPEYWIIPAKCKIVGIAYNRYVSNAVLGNLIKKISNNGIVYTVPLNVINN